MISETRMDDSDPAFRVPADKDAEIYNRERGR